MIERIADMPAGTIGLRASGKLSREDYQQVLEPALREGVESGELRLLFALPDFDGLEPGAMVEDVETGLRAWVRDHSAWKRFAFVTDVEWLAKSMRAFAWLAPGEVRVFALGELDAARDWVSG
ncbi:MAG TPA: STAS/SEC14 domain-containing protein [Solirubrobacterales bacterium]|nr:STAS/SEC14 domain-containing protein [Solirubrobacterales bacterium]